MRSWILDGDLLRASPMPTSTHYFYIFDEFLASHNHSPRPMQRIFSYSKYIMFSFNCFLFMGCRRFVVTQFLFVFLHYFKKYNFCIIYFQFSFHPFGFHLIPILECKFIFGKEIHWSFFRIRRSGNDAVNVVARITATSSSIINFVYAVLLILAFCLPFFTKTFY